MSRDVSGRREFLAAGSLLLPLHVIESLKLAKCSPPHTTHKGTLASIDSFDCDRTLLTAFGERRNVYHCGDSGPAVVVLHELPGMTPFDIDFAARLAAENFRVYMPLLFGQPGDDKFLSHYFGQCMFGRWPWDEIAPVNPWVAPLLEMCERIAGRTSDRIGVIGMCLTGILPIALMQSRTVVAPVVSQPTLPFPIDNGRSVALGLTSGEVRHANDRLTSEGLQILAFRASTDCFCPAVRLDTLEHTFKDRVIRRDVPFGNVQGHSILAAEYYREHAPTAVAEAFKETVSFLSTHLR